MSPFCLGSGMNRGLILRLIIRVSLFYSLGLSSPQGAAMSGGFRVGDVRCGFSFKRDDDGYCVLA